MSTLVYAQLSQEKLAVSRQAPEAGQQAAGQTENAPASQAASAPSTVNSYVETLTALIPAEVLTLHALMLSATTKIEKSDPPVTRISDYPTLSAAFWGLAALSFALYAIPRIYVAVRAARSLWKWLDQLDPGDAARAMIPPLAFVAWTMLQRITAFDAAFPQVTESQRTVCGLFLASTLLASAAWLAFKRPSR